MYHAWWPSNSDPFYQHNIEENTGRINYYDLPWVPFEWVDGVIDIDFPPTDLLFQAAYDERRAQPTTVSLELTGLYRPDTGIVDITVLASTTSALPFGNFCLQVVLTESDLYFNAPNGVQYHEFTMRDMVPDENGTPMSFSGPFPQTDQLSTSFTLDPEYVPENCELVYFLQNNATHEVFQAGSTELMDLLDLTGAAEAPTVFELGRNFPNPFNPKTTVPVSLNKAGMLRLDILDIRGRLVRTLHRGELAAGEHEFIWDGSDAAGHLAGGGVYLYRLEGEKYTQTGKMLLLK